MMNYTSLSPIKNLGGIDNHIVNNNKSTKIMKTEHILPATGAFTLGFLTAILLFALIFIPQYQREVAHSHWADAVIEECQDYYPNFHDTVGEGDNWDNYINSSK